MNIKITGTGSYVPNIIRKNEDFIQSEFLNADGSAFKQKKLIWYGYNVEVQ